MRFAIGNNSGVLKSSVGCDTHRQTRTEAGVKSYGKHPTMTGRLGAEVSLDVLAEHRNCIEYYATL